MINIENKGYQPDIDEMINYVNNPLFSETFSYMDSQYKALQKIEYSGDKNLPGWNVKFKKAGRTLCTVYPRQGHFQLLLVIGNKEKQMTEILLPDLCREFQSIYYNTKEGMGQRWLLFDFATRNEAYDDVLKIIRIRRESK